MRSTFTLFRNLTLSTLNSPRTLPFRLLPTRFHWVLRKDLPEQHQFDDKPLPRPQVTEVPELWRRSRVAWLCKELPAHKAGTLIRILNAQSKWLRQEDTTYIIMHCLPIRENDTAFRVYKWMMQRSWYRFDFALATRLADYMGKECNFAKCRKVFDDIINQGLIPSESTFYILVVAYLTSPVRGCLDEACGIFHRMIQLGGYRPCLSLYNSLFKALVNKPGDFSKQYLKQAEFIYHRMVATGFHVHKDIYGGLIWLHSYQDSIDKERIEALREEMLHAGIDESKEVLVSILRACARVGEVDEADKTWSKLLQLESNPPSQAFVYKMEVYSKVGMPMKSLEVFREMQLKLGGLQIDSDDLRKNHIIRFDFDGNSESHYVLKSHIHRQFYEWLHPTFKPSDDSENIPDKFCTVASSHFGFYADQFWSKGQPTTPKLIHRWLSPCVLAYWYMYGGHRNSSGDVLLKIKGNREGVEKIVKKFKAISIDCKVKGKGMVFWIGILGSNTTWFWKLVEPYILEDVRDFTKADVNMMGQDLMETQDINFNSESDE
ncbi:hypothetical protein TSUD_34450 [Trifolium subterraneum]|uniref:Homing endonuclease LAGLIDADG domain-containing protein n=1 Tax=Trifolium subterraneum TaxID=3900 RepID=A0A2Z6NGC8_TRISU|nr:hypothetical protein TSUD_34450 [Trifolium subterraneum]